MPPMSSTVVLPVVVRAGYRVYLYWTGAGWTVSDLSVVSGSAL